MNPFTYDIDKGINALLYIATSLKGKGGFLQIFKTLYFADKYHIATYGRPIVGDTYIAMPKGPVPSKTYDIIKSVRDNSLFNGNSYKDTFEVIDGKIVVAKIAPDTDFLAESEIEAFNKALQITRNKGFEELSLLSHDSAWKSVTTNSKMSYDEIAKASTDDPAMLKYFLLLSENAGLNLNESSCR